MSYQSGRISKYRREPVKLMREIELILAALAMKKL